MLSKAINQLSLEVGIESDSSAAHLCVLHALLQRTVGELPVPHRSGAQRLPGHCSERSEALQERNDHGCDQGTERNQGHPCGDVQHAGKSDHL